MTFTEAITILQKYKAEDTSFNQKLSMHAGVCFLLSPALFLLIPQPYTILGVIPLTYSWLKLGYMFVKGSPSDSKQNPFNLALRPLFEKVSDFKVRKHLYKISNFIDNNIKDINNITNIATCESLFNTLLSFNTLLENNPERIELLCTLNEPLFLNLIDVINNNKPLSHITFIEIPLFDTSLEKIPLNIIESKEKVPNVQVRPVFVYGSK